VIVLTLQQLMEAHTALGRLAQQPLPIRTAYAVARLLRALAPDATEFQQQRTALITRLGAPRPPRPEEPQGGDVIEVTPANQPEFQRTMAELLAVEVQIDHAPVHLNGGSATISVTAADLLALESFVVLDET
jgi:hypothetical protein